MNSNTPDIHLIDRLLSVIHDDILPLTAAGVSEGNKLFGAAVLNKHDLTTVLAETNNEVESPLWHGEMHLLKRFYELPESDRPDTRDLIFLATHEPCSLCLSAITWCGFDNFYYLFSHQDSRDAFSIPHDLNILKEVFDVDPGQYRRQNAYWKSHGLRELVANLPDTEKTSRQQQIETISASYAALSETYQADKDNNSIPLN